MPDITVELIGKEDISLGTGSFSRTSRTEAGTSTMSQLYAAHIPIKDTAGVIAATNVEEALNENRDAVDVLEATMVIEQSNIDTLETLAGTAINLTLTNKTGGSLAANDLVQIDTANASSVKVIVEGADAEYLVATATIANDASGLFRRIGSVTVATTGTVNIEDYLSASGTAKKAKGSSTKATGNFGIALTAASGNTCTALLWGSTATIPIPIPNTNQYLRAIHVDTTSDTWTKSSSMTSLGFVVVHVIGGGGGGGGADSGAAGAGGGGGGHAWKRIAEGDLGSTETVTIGAGGAGGATTVTGSTGGTSSFGSHATATGGIGGDQTGGGAEGGRGGIGASGNLNSRGGSGVTASHGAGTNMPGGTGGSSYLGGGGAGKGTASTGSGSAGDVYGGGGGGATHNSSGHVGGTGAAGVVVIEEWY